MSLQNKEKNLKHTVYQTAHATCASTQLTHQCFLSEVSLLLLQMKDFWYLEQMIDIKDWEGARALAGYLVDQFQLRADSHTHTHTGEERYW